MNTNSFALAKITDKTILTCEYYTEILGWNSQVWDFENVTSDGYVLPMLKGKYNYLAN